jgi:hypothetical protein
MLPKRNEPEVVEVVPSRYNNQSAKIIDHGQRPWF